MELGSAGSSLQAFEQACTEFEVPATQARAEAVLLEFRQQENALPACQHILEHSKCLQARFQAVLTLREAALRNWGLMGHDAQVGLRSYLLHYILSHADESKLVIAQLVGALVTLLKRGWKDATAAERQAFFAELEAAVRNAGAPPARRAALHILSAVVTEFSPATASPLGQAWEFHEQCRSSLEKDYLRAFFVHAVTVAREAAPLAAAGNDSGVCAACIQLLTAILSWEFRHSSAPVVYGVGRPSNDSLQVKPGAGWRDLLLAPEAVEWLIHLLGSLRGQFSPLASDARTFLVLLCSLSGEVFPSPVAAKRQQLGLQSSEDAHVLYLRRVLLPVLQWIRPPQAALRQADSIDEAELLDACRAVSAAAVVHRAHGFDAAFPPGDERVPEGALGAVSAIAQACISAGGTSEGAEGSWLAQATETLLDAWVELVTEESTRGASTVSHVAAASAGSIFRALTEAALREYAAGAFEDEAEGEAAATGTSEDSSEREQALARSAALARASAEDSMLMLASLMQDRLQQLQTCTHSGSDPSIPLEELCWLLRMGAHVAADSGEGETPLPPLPVSAAAAAAASAGRPDPLEVLSHMMLALFGLCLNDKLKQAASPRLMEAAVWAAARWADTFLLPVDSVSPVMEQAFGATGRGPEVLQVQALVAATLLGGPQWAGEVDLHRVVVAKLLAALVRRRTVCVRLVQVQAWQQVAGAFAAQEGAVQQLTGPLQRILAKVLCQAAVGLSDPASIHRYISHLMHVVAGEISALAGREDLASICDRPDVARRVDSLLSILRGAAAGCSPKTQPALWDLMRAVIGPLAAFAEFFHNDPTITCLLLKLAGEIVEAHISYLEVADANALCEWVIQLLRQYSSHKRGQVSVAASKRLREDAVTDTYRDLRALLKLLTHLTQRDLLDFQTAEAQANGQTVNIAQVVFLGLAILVPLMRDEQLKFPKLARAYFTLLSYMLEVYPECVSNLPESQIGQVLATLRWGICAADLDVAQPSLEALAALARFQAQALAAGTQGITHLQGSTQGPLEGFMEVVFQRLLMEEDWRDLVDAAADSLLPLILAHQAAFQRMGEHLVATQAAPAHRETVSKALAQLLGSNGVTAELDRVNRRRLRSNLSTFVATVREVVRTR